MTREPSRFGTSAVILGGAPQAVSIPPGGELLQRSTFADGRALPWMPLYLPPAAGDTSTKEGAYCLRIDKPGKNLWDVQFRHREMTIRKGHSYYVRYSAWATAPVNIRAKVGMSGAPYTETGANPRRSPRRAKSFPIASRCGWMTIRRPSSRST